MQTMPRYMPDKLGGTWSIWDTVKHEWVKESGVTIDIKTKEECIKKCNKLNDK